jgi:hypothetical protein
MTVLATALALAMAGVLMWAGLEKLRDLNPAVSTIRGIGLPHRLARRGAIVIATAEIAVALGLVFAPQSTWTLTCLAALTATFACAGALALRRDEPIRCSCFGSGGTGWLGWAQIAALPPWLAAGLTVRLGTPDPLPLPTGAGRFMAVALALACLRAYPLTKAWLAARDDRRSAEEMFAWLRSR